MRVIGLTGGIGSGKSTVAGYLAGLGAMVIDLDKVGHEVLKSGSQAFKKVVSEFGKDILEAGGEIDRARLGNLVFKNRKALMRLNRIVHPAIDKIVNEKIEEYRQKRVKVVVLEAAAMLEAGRAAQADEIWVTVAPEATVLNRLSERSGYSEAESRARIRSQLPNEERIKHADVVIATDCSLEELKVRVEVEWRKLMGRSREIAV
jgi:dephospho-CoA kinase